MFVRAGLVVLALAAAFVPLPASLVESWYARGLYPALQPAVTGLSNRVPFALFDLLLILAAAALALALLRTARGPRQGSRVFALIRMGASAAAVAAVVYLAFLAVWGLNYRRVPLERRVDFAKERVTVAAAAALAERAVDRAGALQPQLPRAAWPGWEETADALSAPYARVQRQLGSAREARPAAPKWSLLTFYFERAGVDGMTDPFFLEVLVNQSLLPFERPAVLAHEWAHLAGYADESEASFVGWLACLQGPPTAEYSAHLSLLWQLLPSLPAPERDKLTRRLDPGVREDLRAIARRVSSASPVVRDTAWRVYDRYLKANRVEEGVRSYGKALDLLLGTRLSDRWVPSLTPSP